MQRAEECGCGRGFHHRATTLREGDKGTAVTELQTMLKSLEYYYGSITGSFGSLTKRAVRKFQDDNKLTVDGVAGTATINLLRSKTGDQRLDERLQQRVRP